jgi:hypothetical protein
MLDAIRPAQGQRRTSANSTAANEASPNADSARATSPMNRTRA